MAQQTNPAGAAERERTEGQTDDRAGRLRSAFERAGRSTTAAAVAGGLLLAGAARAAGRSRRRAGALALAGSALLGTAARRRRATPDDGSDGTATDAADEAADGDDSGTKVSAEAHAHRMASDMVDPTKTNPRGVADEPDVDTETDADEGRVRFSTGQDEGVGEKPHIDEADPKDPRYPDEGDPGTGDHVDVSLSETKMTDELGKVAGPDDDQAYPAREGTDPEPMADEAPPRYGEGKGEVPDEDETATDETPSSDDEGEDEESA